MQLSDAQILQAMRRLGLVPADFAVTSEEALQTLQARAKKAYRKAVAELHPDLTQGDREKELQLIALGVVMNDVNALRVPEPVLKTRTKLKFKFRTVRTPCL